jgi:hypothetical protein
MMRGPTAGPRFAIHRPAGERNARCSLRWNGAETFTDGRSTGANSPGSSRLRIDAPAKTRQSPPMAAHGDNHDLFASLYQIERRPSLRPLQKKARGEADLCMLVLLCLPNFKMK